MKYLIYSYFLLNSLHAFADQGLSLSCLKNYRNLVSPVALIETSPGVPQSPRISLPEAAEYNGNLPENCQSELDSSGMLRIITSKGKLYSVEITLNNRKPVLMKYVMPMALSRMEVAFKKNGSAGTNLMVDIDGNLRFDYYISISPLSNFVEKLHYRSRETSRYE